MQTEWPQASGSALGRGAGGSLRLAPLSWAEMSAEQQAMLAPRTDAASLPNIYGVFARHPAHFQALSAFIAYVSRGSTLPARTRELAALRVIWLNQCAYEWGHHERLAQAAGLTAEEIARLPEGPAAAGWNEADRAILRATDLLRASADLDGPSFSALAAVLSEPQLIDFVSLVGCYGLVTAALNVFDVQPDEGRSRLPSLSRGS